MTNITEILLLPDEAQYLGSNFPEFLRQLGSDFPVASLAYDKTTDESAFWQFQAFNYASGNISIDLFWYCNSVVTGSVVWQAQLAAITPESDSQNIETKTLGSSSFVQDTHLGTTAKRVHKSTIVLSDINSLSAEDLCYLKITRDADGTNATDDLDEDVRLLQAVVRYTSS